MFASFVLHFIASVVHHNYFNSPSYCHQGIRIVWKAAVACDSSPTWFIQLLSTHEHDKSSDDAFAGDMLAIPTAQTPQQPSGIINVEVPDALARFGTGADN